MKKQIFRETDGIREKVGVSVLTSEGMLKLGRAIGRFFGSGKVLIGRDSRESGGWMSEALATGMASVGREVWDIGMATTPSVAYLAKNEDVVGGIMVTASHNPADENGIKVFDANGSKLLDEQEIEIEKLFFADNGGDASAELRDKVELMEDYEQAVRGGMDLSGRKICIDSAAGGAWGLAKDIFVGVGAQAIEVGQEPSGKNINEGSGALHPELLAEAVVRMGADMGVALDGDADRFVLVDDEGRVWDGDRIAAALAMWMKGEERLVGDAVVMTEYSNLGAVQFLEKNGVRVEKVMNGDRAVAQKCEEIGAILGGEVAGHIIYLPWLNSSDGVFAAFLVLSFVAKTGKKLSEMRPAYENLPSRQWGIDVREKVPVEEVKGWSEEFARQEEILGADGRIFVRYSGTEDKLRILVEAKDAEKMEAVGTILSEIIEKEIGR